MIRLAALGALGYAAYRYFQKNPLSTQGRADDRVSADVVAGGPLSDKATVQHTPELPG